MTTLYFVSIKSNIFTSTVQLCLVSEVIMADTSLDILAVLRHYFKLNLKAGEVVRKILEVEGN